MTPEGKEICKHCRMPLNRHLRSGLLDHWDCPRYDPTRGSTHFESINKFESVDDFKSALRKEIEMAMSTAPSIEADIYNDGLARALQLLDSVTPPKQ